MAEAQIPADRPIRQISSWKVFGIFCLVMFLFFLGVVFTPWDVTPVAAPDLESRSPALAPEENAFPHFEAAGNMQVVRFPASAAGDRNWTDLATAVGSSMEKWDPAFADEVLTANAAVFQELEAGLACKGYVSPLLEDFSTLMPWLQKHKQLVQLLCLKSKRAQFAGDPVAAVRAASQAWRLGQLVTDDADSLIEWLVGIACQSIALARFEEIIADAKTPEPVLQDILAQLDRWNPQGVEQGYRQAMKCEYRLGKSGIKQFRQVDAKLLGIMGVDSRLCYFARIPYLLKTNMTTEMMASFYRNMIENADRSCAKMNLDYPGKPKTPTGGLEKIAMIVGPNSVGKILFSMLAPTMERALTKKCHPQTNVAAMRLKTGLRLYELKHGQLPDRLDALVPDFLKEIPKDPFDDQPLRYSKPDKTVWAVGSDLTDNGGKMEKGDKLRDRRGFDLVLPLGTRDLKPTPPPAQNESKK